MSQVGQRFRSYKRIRLVDLERLAKLALADHKRFFSEHPRWGRLYGGRRFVMVLAQGAANHLVTGRKGINDFDVWTFWEQHPEAPMPYRRHKSIDFGDNRFGRSKDKPAWTGRRVDLLRRSIARQRGETMTKALLRYLERPRTRSAWYLSREPVFRLRPRPRRIVRMGDAPASGPPREHAS